MCAARRGSRATGELRAPPGDPRRGFQARAALRRAKRGGREDVTPVSVAAATVALWGEATGRGDGRAGG